MKKAVNVLRIFLIIFILLCISNNVYGTTITLKQIVEKFNQSSIVDDYKKAGGSINATNDTNSINVTLSLNGKTQNVILLLNENILEIEIEKGESSFAQTYITANIIDIIGQLQEYEEGELSRTINSEEATNYIVEQEGYELEDLTATKLKIKVDLTKKIPLVDFSNTYIEVEDLELYKDSITEDGSAARIKENIYFSKVGYDGENTILIAEKR